MYALLIRENEDKSIYNVSNFYLKYGVQSFYKITDEDMDKAEELVQEIYEKTKSDKQEDYPCNPDYIFCKQDWCSQCTEDCPCHEDYVPPEEKSAFAKAAEEELEEEEDTDEGD